MRDYFSATRRFNYPIPVVEVEKLQTKCQHLNSAIKKLVFSTLLPAPDAGYYVSGTTLVAPSADDVPERRWS